MGKKVSLCVREVNLVADVSKLLHNPDKDETHIPVEICTIGKDQPGQ